MNNLVTRKSARRTIVLVALMLITAMTSALGETAAPFAGGEGSAASPYAIETAAQLDSVRDYLGSSFILQADIDLSTYESWTPIGAYAPADAAAGDYTADTAIAFTGSLDGNGHTISGLTITRDGISAEDMSGTGLFGAIAGEASIQNLTIENAAISSTGCCVAALVGMAMSAHENAIYGVALTGMNTISGAGSVAGLVGSAQDTNIIDCSAAADVVMTSVGNGAGILGGGLEGGIISGCTATGTVAAVQSMEYEGMSIGSIGIGGLAGCAFDSQEVADCVVQSATINVGDHASMIGGLVGYAGVVNEGPFATDPEGFTRIIGCEVTDSTITAGSGATNIGGIAGSGFCGSSYVSYYPATSAIHIIGCTATGSITADEEALAGSILGYAYQNCAVVSCDGSGMTGVAHQVGAADAGRAVALSEMK